METGSVTGHEIEHNDSNVPTYAQLLAANTDKDKTIAIQAATIKKQTEIIEQLQKKSWFDWFKGCSL